MGRKIRPGRFLSAGFAATLVLAVLAAPALGESVKAADRGEQARSQQGRVLTDSDVNEGQSIPSANRHQALSDETRKRIPAHSPEWTDHNDHDPGVTILESTAKDVRAKRNDDDQLRGKIQQAPTPVAPR